MAAGIDLWTLFLAVGVVGLVGWYVWHVIASYIATGKRIANFLDGRAERQRLALGREAAQGRLPLWYRAGRFLSLGLLIAGLAALALMTFRGA